MSPWVRRRASRGGTVRSSMSFRGKRELLVQVAPRYGRARHGHRSVILDEFVAVTGYERKYAIRLLLGPIRPPAPIRRPRAAQYGPNVREAGYRSTRAPDQRADAAQDNAQLVDITSGEGIRLRHLAIMAWMAPSPVAP